MHTIVIPNYSDWHHPGHGCDASSFQNGMTLSLDFIGRLRFEARISLVRKQRRIGVQKGVTMFDEKNHRLVREHPMAVPESTVSHCSTVIRRRPS
jgi:hypothetical protein